MVAKLRQNGDALQAHLVAKQNEANRLRETISALIAQEQAKAEAERRAREKAEADRIAKEKAEAERVAAEKAAAEKAAAERAAAEKKDSEKAVPARKSDDGHSAEKVVKEKKKAENERKKNSEKSARKKNDRKKRKQESAKEPEKNVGPTPGVSPKTVEKASATPAAYVNFASLRGSLPRPVDGSWRITNPFGRHAMPELPEVEYD
ncbi:MAG: hypothetical protein K2H49_03130, partial [Muribaculaceae bacterium]|nr:hypothetical protein [Muribaculaceae bacterium]